MHWCANLVCAPEGMGAAVLLRAIEPLEGFDAMMARRKMVERSDGQAVSARAKGLCDGPGKLTQALGITRALDGQRMSASEVSIHRGMRVADRHLMVTPRVGITRAVDWPLRYTVRE